MLCPYCEEPIHDDCQVCPECGEPLVDNPDVDYDEYDDSMDGDHASGLASAGWGTDEDYGGGDWDM